MLIWVVLVGVALAGLLVVTFAVLSARQHRRRCRSLWQVARPPALDIAYRAVVNARSAFTRSVQAYEEALAAAGNARSGAGSGLPGDSRTQAEDLKTMESRKDQRRSRLLEAQRMWEDVRPAVGADSPVNMWLGAGELRGWSLGLIGHETALLRLQHAVDTGCWVVVETRRLRIGPAFGAERLTLGIVIEGASIEQLTGLVQLAMGSPEVAVRPGTSIVRLLTRRRLREKALFEALRRSVRSGNSQYLDGFGPMVERLSLRHLSQAGALNLDQAHAGLAGHTDTLNLRISSSGPAFLFGAWFGRRPAARVLASSNHQTWLPSNRLHG